MSSILLQYPKNPKVEANWEPFRIFLPSINVKHQKSEGDPLGKIFFEKKSHDAEKKTEKRLVSERPGTVCYAEKPFWFSSLGEMVQFDTIIFPRTFEEVFWSVRVDRKKSL